MKGRLAIQHVQLHWDKAGRGAEWGAVRNALPRELPFAAPGESGTGWLHRVTFNARDTYRRDEAWDDLAIVDGRRVPVKTRIDGEHLWLKMAVGMRFPLRAHLEDQWIARLPFGQRLTFRANSKSDGDHERWYFEDHLHIGWAQGCTLDLPLFREVDERVILY